MSISGGAGADHDASASLTWIEGGSVKLGRLDTLGVHAIQDVPRNGLGEELRCVTVGGFAAGAAVSAGRLPTWYGTTGLYADGEGKVYLWLPDGTHSLGLGGNHYTATVAGEDTVAVLADEAEPVHYLSGTVTVLAGGNAAGLRVRLGDGTAETRTEADGGYTLTVPAGWSGRVELADGGACYLPANGHAFEDLDADHVGLDFAQTTSGVSVDGTDVGAWDGEEDWEYADGVLTIHGGTHTVASTVGRTSIRILVDEDGTLTLRNVRVNAADTVLGAALEIADGVACTLVLEGENEMTSGAGRAGVEVGTGASVRVSETSTGTLAANGGGKWAGIGGKGNVEIAGGRIQAHGGFQAAGAGGWMADTDQLRIWMTNGYTLIQPGLKYWFHDSGGAGFNYKNNEDYTYTFSSYNGAPLRITFRAFATEASDFLTIYDGLTQLAKGAAKELEGQSFTAASGTMQFHFRSDGIDTWSGWNAEFDVLPGDSPTVVNINMNSGNTVLRPGVTYRFYDSGGPNGNYGNNDSLHTFRSFDGSPLRLVFSDYGIGDSRYDYLSITNGHGQLLMSSYYNSDILWRTYTATDGVMKVWWHYYYGGYRGWAAQFEPLAAPNPSFRVTGGTVELCGGPGAEHDVSATVVGIEGGSVRLDRREALGIHAVQEVPRNAAGEELHCVTVGGFAAGAAVSAGRLPTGYGATSLYADGDGKVYLWLPDGEYALGLGGNHYAATVAGTDTEAEMAEEEERSYFLSGTVTALGAGNVAGLRVRLVDGEGETTAETRTDEDGGYTLTAPEGWSGTVELTDGGACYEPAAGYDFVDLDTDHCGLDFAQRVLGVSVDGTDVGAGSGTGWAYADGLLTIHGGTHVVAGSVGRTSIRILMDADGTLTLRNVRVNAEGIVSGAALEIAEGVVCTLVLEGENEMTGGPGRAGVEVGLGGTVRVSEASTGTLAANGGSYWPGIGGAGAIEIAGGRIQSQGGYYGAGMGGWTPHSDQQRIWMTNGATVLQPGTKYYFHDHGGPGFNYGNNENYTYTFASHDGSPVRITFSLFATEASDLLTIYDGDAFLAKGGAREFEGKSYTATSGTMRFTFRADGKDTWTGWNAEFDVLPGGSPTVVNVNMNSGSTVLRPGITYRFYDSGGPNGNYGNNDSLHTFRSFDGSPLRLVFSDYGIGDSRYDYLSITNGHGQLLMSSYYNSDILWRTYTATDGVMKVWWHYYYGGYRGWTAQFEPLAMHGASLQVTGGTLEICGGVGSDHDAAAGLMGVLGGSVKLARRDELGVHAIQYVPVNGEGEELHCVTVGGFAAGAAVSAGRLPTGYGATSLYADGEGKVYLWLPDGTYQLGLGGNHYAATVAGADTVAELAEEEERSYYLSGTVTALAVGHVADLRVRLVDGDGETTAETRTDEGGGYTLTAPEGWSGTVELADGGANYRPTGGHAIEGLDNDVTGLDFVQSVLGVSVDGTDVGEGSGTGWAYADGLLTIHGGTHVVEGVVGRTAIRVLVDADGTLTLRNLRVNAAEIVMGAAMEIAAGVDCTLVLEGANEMTSGPGRAGVEVGAGGTVRISAASTGTLDANGGTHWAGIGGEGNVEIDGGQVQAHGGYLGAGLGGHVTDTDQIRIWMTNGYTVVQPGTKYYFHDHGGPGFNYGNNENYTYTFSSYNGDPLRITFSLFATEASDLLTMYDGNAFLAKGAARELEGKSYTATSGTMRVVFKSDGKDTWTGWNAEFDVLPGESPRVVNVNMNNGETVLQPGVTYRFYDSGGPNGNYGNNDTIHTFRSFDGSPLRLVFSDFGVGDSRYDFISITNGHGQLLMSSYYNSDILWRTYTATDGVMKVRWHYYYGGYRGWAAQFEPLGTPSGRVKVNGGTLLVGGGGGGDHDLVAESVEITGGSVKVERMEQLGVQAIQTQPVDGEGRTVHCVTFDGLTAGAVMPVTWAPLWYGMNGVRADAEGKAYLWLPDGEEKWGLDGAHYATTVSGAHTTATLLEGVRYLMGTVTNPMAGYAMTGEGVKAGTAAETATDAGGRYLLAVPTTWSGKVEIAAGAECYSPEGGHTVAAGTADVSGLDFRKDKVGVKVDGTDIGAGSGTGWTFVDPELTISGTHTVEGTGGTAAMRIRATNDAALTLRNLAVDSTANGGRAGGGAALAVERGVQAKLVLEGTNTLRSGAGWAGVDVGRASGLCSQTVTFRNNLDFALENYAFDWWQAERGGMGVDLCQVRVFDENGEPAAWWSEGREGAGYRLWIKTSLAAGASKTYTVYWGATEGMAGGQSADGAAFFTFFDGFNGTSLDGAKWAVLKNGGDFRVENGHLLLSNSRARIYTKTAWGKPNVAAEAKLQANPYLGSGQVTVGFTRNTSDSYSDCLAIYDYGCLHVRNNSLWMIWTPNYNQWGMNCLPAIMSDTNEKIHTIVVTNSSFVGIRGRRTADGVETFRVDGITNSVDNEYLSIGCRYGESFDGTGLVSWDWIRVRPYYDGLAAAEVGEVTVTGMGPSALEREGSLEIAAESTGVLVAEGGAGAPGIGGWPQGSGTKDIWMANGETVLMPGVTYRFYDDGGPNGQYTANTGLAHGFRSYNGAPVRLKYDSYTSYNTSYDQTLISSRNDVRVGWAAPSTGTVYEGTDGELTVAWRSKSGNRQTGWAATFTAYPNGDGAGSVAIRGGTVKAIGGAWAL